MLQTTLTVLFGASGGAARAAEPDERGERRRAAIEAAVDLLTRRQSPRGDFATDDAGAAALVALALAASGQLIGEGEAGDALARAVRFLASTVQPGGRLGGKESRLGGGAHHWALLAIAQVGSASDEETVSSALSAALHYTLQQRTDGGWPAEPAMDGRGAMNQPALLPTSLALSGLRAAASCGIIAWPAPLSADATGSLRERFRSTASGPDEARQRAVPGRYADPANVSDGASAADRSLRASAAGAVAEWSIPGRDPWRAERSVAATAQAVSRQPVVVGSGTLPWDGATTAMAGLSLHLSGDASRAAFDRLTDILAAAQFRDPGGERHGEWRDSTVADDRSAPIIGTAAGCFALAIVDRLMPWPTGPD